MDERQEREVRASSGRSPLACSLAIATMLGACSASRKEDRQWTEEVRLEDGSTIEVERSVTFQATNALGGGAYNAVETSSTLKFTGELGSMPAWHFPRIALLLYRSKTSGNWIVVSTTSSCEVWALNGKPRPPYWQHELVGDQWKGVPLSNESLNKATNLLYEYSDEDLDAHIDSDERVRLQSDERIADKYRYITPNPRDFGCMG